VRASIINLLDEADISKLNQLSQLINKHRRATWIDIHNLRVLKYGNHLHVDCHLTLPWYQSLEVSHQEVSGLEALVRNEWDDEIEFFIHADPCLPTSCAICIVEGCAHRTAPFQQRIEWNLNNMLPDQKHKLDTPN
jgi:divalent metal cation (Fe/Co/Zn/Cd) transporter